MKKDNEELKKHIFKRVRPIFEKVLNEKISSTMSVVPTIIFFWQPNNYRLKIPFYDNRTLPLKRRNFKFPMELKYSNYNSKVTTRINGITIMKDKNSITAIYSLKELGKKVWYKVECNSIRDIEIRINERVLDIENKCMDALRVFVENFGGRGYFDEKEWIRHEDAIHGEDFIDKIPQDLIIHDTYFKKVYSDHPEFKSPIYLKNYVSNRAVEELAPEIAKEISDLKKVFTKLDESINLEIYNKKLHLKVLRSMDKTLKSIRGEKRKRKKKVSEFQTRLFS